MRITRRQLVLGAAASGLVGCTPRRLPGRPELRWGVQSGEVDASSAVIWARTSREARFKVEWSTSPSFDRVVRVDGPVATEETDFTGKVRLTGLPSGVPIHYRAGFDDSELELGSLTTAPLDDRSVLLAWSADVNGQGYGFDPAQGGMPAFRALLERRPDLFIHCGDGIYADVPIEPYIGSWNAFIDPERGPGPARTLKELRAAWRYARHCREVRQLSAAVPIVAIWDDHEVTDNWAPGVIPAALLDDARRAMYEHLPTLRDPLLPMYRVMRWGPLVDVFLLDGRSGRTHTKMLGDAQVTWLIDALGASTAVWKIIAMGQPIGESVTSFDAAGEIEWDTWANDAGVPVDREVELARILSAIKARNIANVVWISADVHYGAATRFDPARAAFKDFLPFWELIAGPMHAKTFPPNPLDDTFGPEREWISARPDRGRDDRGTPQNGEQYVGLLAIDGKTRALTVTWIDARGRDAHRLVLPAA
ncbi:MAG: alkaline phosphatase D family protein [Labilithrix sp.]